MGLYEKDANETGGMHRWLRISRDVTVALVVTLRGLCRCVGLRALYRYTLVLRHSETHKSVYTRLVYLICIEIHNIYHYK